MDKQLKKDLTRFGQVEEDSMTWVHPWGTYWHLYCSKHRDLLIKILSNKYPDYLFVKEDVHINNVIFQVINLRKK